jgi:hypothetical protein
MDPENKLKKPDLKVVQNWGGNSISPLSISGIPERLSSGERILK